jgi:polyisoprenoid-binding protein YceI
MTIQTKWSIDQAHSEITFRVKHLMIAHVMGTFKVFDASIHTIGNDFSTAEVDLWIDASSITTGEETRDKHLKSADFFDVQKHKQITFTSSTIGKADPEGNYELWGELTIRGITQNVKFNLRFGGIIKDPWGNEKAGFSVTGSIKRSNWELVWNTILETGGLMISDEVNILFEVELTNAGQKDLTMELESAAEEEKILQ